jgi:hypothetical protein
MAGNFTTFGGAVENAIKKNQLSPAERKAAERLAQLSPAERKIQADLDRKRAAAKSTKTGKAVTVADDAAKITRAGSKAGGALKVVGKGLGKIAAPLAALEQAYQTGRLVFNEDAREEAAQGYEDMADDNALMRTAKGALGGVTTIYGAGKSLYDYGDTMKDVINSSRELDKKMSDPKTKSMLQDVKDRQATYMGLSKEERALVDGMGGKEAKQYLQDKQTPPSMKKGPPSFVRPPKSAMLPESMKEGSPSFVGPPKSAMFPESMKEGSPSFIGPRVPKAIPVAEPVEVDQDRAMALFQNTHGGPFDPKSSMDKAKMATIQNLMAQKGSESLTPNQFSLKIYRQS